MNLTQFEAKFRKGEDWIGGRSFYPDQTPLETVIIGIRMSLEGQNKIDDSWELFELNNNPVQMTSDGAIIDRMGI